MFSFRSLDSAVSAGDSQQSRHANGRVLSLNPSPSSIHSSLSLASLADQRTLPRNARKRVRHGTRLSKDRSQRYIVPQVPSCLQLPISNTHTGLLQSRNQDPAPVREPLPPNQPPSPAPPWNTKRVRLLEVGQVAVYLVSCRERVEE